VFDSLYITRVSFFIYCRKISTRKNIWFDQSYTGSLRDGGKNHSLVCEHRFKVGNSMHTKQRRKIRNDNDCHLATLKFSNWSRFFFGIFKTSCIRVRDNDTLYVCRFEKRLTFLFFIRWKKERRAIVLVGTGREKKGEKFKFLIYRLLVACARIYILKRTQWLGDAIARSFHLAFYTHWASISGSPRNGVEKQSYFSFHVTMECYFCTCCCFSFYCALFL
jgi:hypothetical protein